MSDEAPSGLNDEELNKMIANLQGGASGPTVGQTGVPTPPSATPADDPAPAAKPSDDKKKPVEPVPTPTPPAPSVPAPSPAPAVGAELQTIKRDVLAELRPLVDKLALSAEDKFDIILLMIRSTDDSTLVPTAYEAAKQIADEGRRAQALLDIVKEIDFFGSQAK